MSATTCRSLKLLNSWVASDLATQPPSSKADAEGELTDPLLGLPEITRVRLGLHEGREHPAGTVSHA